MTTLMAVDHRNAALQDLRDGISRWQLWGLLGWQDILQRYRRSVLGPFWITASMGVLVTALGLLYANLFRIDVAAFLPFIAVGFIFWTYISTTLNEGCSVFISAEGIIKQLDMPLSLHAFRAVWRNLIILAHNLIVLVVVAVVFSVDFGLQTLAIIPGLALLVLNIIWMMIVLGFAGARYRDIAPIVGSILQLAFFLTPIIWKPELLQGRVFILNANPFYHFIELVRAPLLGESVGMISWIVVVVITLLGWMMALEVLSRYGRRLAYWL